MAAVPKGLKCLCFGMCPKCLAIVAWVIEALGLASLVLGIIAGVKYEAIFELWSTEWFLIAIALFILGLWAWLMAYAAAKE